MYCTIIIIHLIDGPRLKKNIYYRIITNNYINYQGSGIYAHAYLFEK